MRRLTLFCLALLLVSGGFSTARAQGRGRGDAPANQATRGGDTDVDIDVDIIFGDGELRLIRAWFGDSRNLSGLPPGLAKRDTLPPGLQRQLQRNGTLPPGLQSRIHPIPVELDRRLPTLGEGVRRVIIGGSIVLFNEKSSLILDVAAIF